MLSKVPDTIKHVQHGVFWRLLVAAVVWLVLISYLHVWLNAEDLERRLIRIGYMPVITNLAAPLLDYASEQQEGVRYQALKFGSFAEIAESLRNGSIDAGFMIAPLSIVMQQQGADIKIVAIGNRHESTLVARKDLNAKRIEDLIGKTVAVPMRYSGHNLSMLKLLEDKNLTGQIKIVEMHPPDMASALSIGALDAYYVGEPFAAQTIKSGDSDIVHYVEEVWPDFICNLVVVRGDLIKKEPDIIEKMVQGAARSGAWANKHPKEAAEIASKYWNQSSELLEFAMTTPHERIRFNQFVPKHSEIQYMADLMVHFGLLEDNSIEGLIDDRFAKNVYLEDVHDVRSIISSTN